MKIEDKQKIMQDLLFYGTAFKCVQEKDGEICEEYVPYQAALHIIQSNSEMAKNLYCVEHSLDKREGY